MEFANLNILDETELLSIMSAVKIKRGMATKVKLFNEVNICMPRNARFTPLSNAYNKAELIIAKAIGIPLMNNTAKHIRNNSRSIFLAC
jgi:hypothetical protein